LSVLVKRVLLATLAIALVAGCGSSDSEGGAVALARAAAETRGAGSARLALTTQLELEGGESITVEGEGAYDRDRERSRLHYSLSGGEQTLEFELVLVEEVMYQRFPPVIAERDLPAGRPWVRYPLEEFGRSFPANVLVRLVDDPASFVFGAQDDSQVNRIGTDEVRGVETTHYRLILDVPRRDEPSLDEQTRQRLEELRESGVTELVVEVWIDADDLIRRTDVRYENATFEGRAADVQSRVELYDFGAEVEIEPPPTGDVTTHEELVERAEEPG
jgi:hypothetical protein